MEPLRRWADHVIDTTDTDRQRAPAADPRSASAAATIAPTLTSCRSASPAACRATPTSSSTCASSESALGGRAARPDRPRRRRSATYIAGDEAYEEALARIEELLLAPAPALPGRRKILCLGRLRLYRRATSLGPCRRAGRGTVARGGIFAHGRPSRPRLAAARRYRASAGAGHGADRTVKVIE